MGLVVRRGVINFSWIFTTNLQLINAHDRREFVFLISILSNENLIEMADIYLELSTRLQHTNQAST